MPTSDPPLNISPLPAYAQLVFDGGYDWIDEPAVLRQLWTQLLGTGERAEQQAIAAQMERHIRDQALLLSLYAPLHLYAVNKEVHFVPPPSGRLFLGSTGVTEQHWSVRKHDVVVHE